MISKSNLYAGNFISGLNAWAIGVMRYSEGIIDWTKEELHDMHQKYRNRMTLNRCLYPRSSVTRLYMKRNEGWRGLISVEDCITTERRGLYDCLKESKEDMLSISHIFKALKENVIEDGETKEEFKKKKRRRKMNERKKTLHKGKLQGQLVEKTRNIAHKLPGKWIRNGFLKKETDDMLFAAEQAPIQSKQVLPNVDCVGQKKRPLCI